MNAREDFRGIAPKVEAMIEGSFRDVSLPALMQLLCFETNKSFRIRVTAENQKGYILVRRGTVIAAKFGILEGEDAVCEFLCWEDGGFLAEQVVAQTDVEKNLRFDIKPSAHFIEDCAVLVEQHIGLNSEITGSQFFGSPEWKALVKEYPLDRECFSVLAWLREGRKMHQALREFGLDIVRATAILAALIRTQSIQVIRPGMSALVERDSPRPEHSMISTTGGQQEAAANLAREAARALESADVGDAAFLSTSFKSSVVQEQKGEETSESQTQSGEYTQVRTSMEARLRAKKNSSTGSNIPAYAGDKTGANPASTKQALAGKTGSEPAKIPRPDLNSVLQNLPKKIIDVGSSKPNQGQATASTHDIASLRQANLKEGTTQPHSSSKKNGEGNSDSIIRKVVEPVAESEANQKAAPKQVEKTASVDASSPSPFAKLTKSIMDPARLSGPDSEKQVAPRSPAASASADNTPPGAAPIAALAAAENNRESLSFEPRNPIAENTAPPAPPIPAQPLAAGARQIPAAPHLPPTAPTLAPVAEPPALETPAEELVSEPLPASDRRFIAKTEAMPLVAFDIERLLLTTFIATQFGKLALGNPSLDPHRRQTLLDAEYGKTLSAAIEDGNRPPAAVLSSYRYCLDRGYIETHDPVIPLTADLLLGRMEIDQYLLQRRRISGDELRDLMKVAREEGIKLIQVLLKSGYLTEADLETLGREQKRFAFR